MAEIKRYVAGSPATFTPSKKSKWTDEFNNLLVTSGYSRNALTEHLITVGLAHTEQQIKPLENIEEDTLFSNAYFTPMERELLNTSTYQQIIREFARSLLSNSKAAMESTFNQASTSNYPRNYSPVKMEMAPVDQPALTPNDATSSPTQVQSSSDKTENTYENLTSENDENNGPTIIDEVNNTRNEVVEVVEVNEVDEVDEVDGFEVADLSAEADFLKGLKMD